MASWTTALWVILVCGQAWAETVPADFIENAYKRGKSSRILSGWEAQPGQHPHHASLRLVNGAGGVSGCGGSVVHHQWVITAAHCTATQVTIVVRAGVVCLTTPEYIAETDEWYNHPTYDESTPMVVQPNDIALIKLKIPVVFSKLLQPIRIQSSVDAFRDYNGWVLHASGHGLTWTNGVSPENLRWVYLRAVSNKLCEDTYGTKLINSNAICTTGYNVSSQSPCQGDSGGPLVDVESTGVPTLVGVASFVAGGDHGCHSGLPAGFIRTGPFLQWYEEVTGIDFEKVDVPTPPPEDISTTIKSMTTTEMPTQYSTTTYIPTEAPTRPPVTIPPTITTEIPTTTEEPEEGDSSEESGEDDEELSELLKRLEVQVKVKVKLNKYGKKKEHKHKEEITA